MTVSKKLPGNIASSLRLIELLINDENHSDALFHLQTLQQTLPRLSDDSSKLIRKILDLLHNLGNLFFLEFFVGVICFLFYLLKETAWENFSLIMAIV